MNDIKTYTGDKPITEEGEDRFQRYGFSKRIAETIINRNSTDCIVIGIFGAWGEGKSSVLNFINQEIRKQGQIITIQLNPWRYSDEDSLLKSFFQKIAEALGKQLETNKEKVGSFFEKYGSVGDLLGFDLSQLGKAAASVNLEKFKERVNDFLADSDNKVVIFFDDIDRLDKQEIYSLFRLIKLTADFSNTTYVLAFDEAMVAAAIGGRFGFGDKKSGTNFLEKIVQVPLTIPKAQPEALKKFCFDLINHAINSAGIVLNDKDGQRFVYQFSTNILPQLSTPRSAVRYGNALLFSAPILKGEVNIVDLMLIEAIKIFYPEYYNFIKLNPDYFIGLYSNDGSFFNNNRGKIPAIEAHLNELGESYNKSCQRNILDLLTDLFPVLNTAFNNYVYTSEDYNNWYVDKKIGSTKYFERYFSYSVLDGDISDVAFESLIESISIKKPEDVAKNMFEIIEQSNADNFIRKLRSRENEYSWDLGVKIIKGVCHLANVLNDEGGLLGFNYDSSSEQAAILIFQLLKRFNKKENIFDLAKDLMTYPQDFSFAYKINRWLRADNKLDDQLFKIDQYKELAELLMTRAIEEANSKSTTIFELYPSNQIYFIVESCMENDKNFLKNYIRNFLDEDVNNILLFLKSFVPMGISTARKGEYKTNINQEIYKFIVSCFDKNELYKRLIGVFPEEIIEKTPPYKIDFGLEEFTDLNMARQFVQYYKQDYVESDALG